ncbi:hypothetical protein LTR84_004433 [Exophiala bonariae]|uniref:Uncharacterized protein n=1 Tax=Exophiala bonariae TaxID=1690606 RepID=A0AAV9N8U7_9EURO|nr:hypothetical protein LTR84_004433 [Exophiala bonariae]
MADSRVDPKKIERILRERFHPRKEESGMLTMFLHNGSTVVDSIQMAQGRELRMLALEAWNKAKPMDLERLKKDPDMTQGLERYMDQLTMANAKDIQTAQARPLVVG